MMAVGKLTVFVFLCLVLTLIFVPAKGAVIHQKRSINEEGKPQVDCERNTPCGWAIYTPFTRTVDYFMKNSCTCFDGKQCVRTDDDISVSAFVYRCREPSNPNTSAPTKSS